MKSMYKMLGKEKYIGYVGWSILVSFLALAQFRLILLVMGPRLEHILNAAYGIVEGTPHWRIFQSRIMGPYLAEFFGNLLNVGFQNGFMISVVFLFVVFYAVFIFVCKSILVDRSKIMLAIVTAFTLNTILIQGYWLYLWDIIDLIVFTLFIWGVLKKKSFWFLLGLILIETFNREVALFLAGWMILDAFIRIPTKTKSIFSKDLISINYKQAVASLIVLLISYFTIELLRDTLLIREVGPEIFSDVKESGTIINLQLWGNLNAFARSFYDPLHHYNIVFNVIILYIPVWAVFSIKNGDYDEKRINLFALILWFLILFFGLIYETRVWLSLVPIISILASRNLFLFVSNSSRNHKD